MSEQATDESSFSASRGGTQIITPNDEHENNENAELPLFVYGTLRHGQENYMLLRGHTVAEIPAVLDRAVMYSLQAFPVITQGDSTVHGELMTLHPQAYWRVLADLDQLEGYNPNDALSFYRRVARYVRTESGIDVLAWVYMGNERFVIQRPNVLVPDGDWCRYRREVVRSTRFARFASNSTYEEQS
jgi:gamma-glutamylcyclotransferase (GGCT)/AIG2-like uncharacterized protein YtfP